MKEKCRKIQDLFSDYIDQRLSHQDLEEVREHLKSCKRCSNEYESFRSMIRMLHSAEKVNPPDDFVKKVNQRIEDEKSIGNSLKKIFEEQNLKVPLTLCVVGLLVFIGIQPFYKKYINRPYMVKEQSQDLSDKIKKPVSKRFSVVGRAEVKTETIDKEDQGYEPNYIQSFDTVEKEEALALAPRASSLEEKRKAVRDELAGGFVYQERELKEKPQNYQIDSASEPAVSERKRKQSIYIGPYILTVQSKSIRLAKEKIEKILESKNINKLVLADNEDSFSEITIDVTVVEFNSLINSMIEQGIIILDVPAVVDRGKSFPLRISIKKEN